MSNRKDAKKPEPDEKIESVDRKCLKCGEAFVAEGRFIRLCNRCRSSNAAYAPHCEGMNL